MTRCIATLALLLATVATAPTNAAEAAIEYGTHIAPLFRAYCEGCHAADAPESDFSLDSYEALLRGGKGGPVLVAGRVEDSRLLAMIEGRLEPKMPPEDSEQPTAEEISLIRAWIEAGAAGPNGQTHDPTVLHVPKIVPRVVGSESVQAVAVSADGALVAMAKYGKVELVDLNTRDVVRRFGPIRGNVTDLAFSTDGSRLVTAAGEPGLFGEAQIWNVADGALVGTFTGHSDSLYAIALGPDGKVLATAGYDQKILLWDTASREVLATIAGHNGAIFDLAFRVGGETLASASADRTVKLWSARDGRRLETLGQATKELYAVAFSPDGRRVLAGGVDNRIRVWQVSPSAKEGTNPLRVTRFAHEGAILAIVFSEDGKLIASAGEDRTIRVWDGQTLVEKSLLPTQSDWTAALDFTPDGQRLVVGRHDGTLAVYDVSTSAEVPRARPELVRVSPRGVRSGKTTKLRLSGKGLVGAKTVKANHDGISLRLIPSESMASNDLTVELTAASDVPRGAYSLAVESDAGTSDGMPIYVDDLPQRTEREPNDVARDALFQPGSVDVWGTLAAQGDVDHYKFEVDAGRTLVAMLAAKSIGSPVDGVLSILDPLGRVVATSGETGMASDVIAHHQVTLSGEYTIRVRDRAAAGSATHAYRLTAGALAVVVDVVPHVVAADREVDLTPIGFNLDSTSTIRGTYAAGQHMVPLEAQWRSPAPVRVMAIAGNLVHESEPNDSRDQALAAEAPFEAVGRIVAAGRGSDSDLYRFHARAGETWIIETAAAREGSPLDTKLDLLDDAGQPIPRVTLRAVRDTFITFRSIDSVFLEPRLTNWEEIGLNEFLYMQGEVCKTFRMPRGPDSGHALYTGNGKRQGYFDTTATAHALDEPCYVVVPRAVGAPVIPNGLPVFTVNYANDDDAERELGTDSRLTFTAPVDGDYLVRVSDSRGIGGECHRYRLSVRRPMPDFRVRLTKRSFEVNRGSGRSVALAVDRVDGFDGEITLDITGLPKGFEASTPTTIQAGHFQALVAIHAAADAPELPADFKPSSIKIVSRAQVGDVVVEHRVTSFADFKLAAAPGVTVRLEPAELAVAPGGTVKATLVLDRSGGYDERVPFEVFNLPHGVIVANLGLNGVLIPEGQSRREIFISAEEWVPETDRAVFAETENLRGATPGTQASPAVTLRVRKADTLADSAGAAEPPAGGAGK